MRILGIAGSLRESSYNRALLRAARELLPEGVELVEHDLRDLPFYDGDVEAAGDPDSVVAFKEAIRDADALLIATPEYNRGVPGVLKNAIDWASRPPATSPLRGKPAGIIGAGGMSGTMRAQYHLRQIFVFTNTLVMQQPEVFVARAAERFDSNLALTDDAIREALRKHAAALAAWTRKVK